jgi:nitrogen fixation NifU-like protein
MSKQNALKELLLKAGYPAKTIRLYLNKVNVGAIEHPSVVSTYAGPICGDTITLYLTLKNEIINDAKFEYEGCVGTASSGSAITTLIMGKTVTEAWAITKDDVLTELDGIPESHCADIAVNALHGALKKLTKESTGEKV